jgi:hypothetical protein
LSFEFTHYCGFFLDEHDTGFSSSVVLSFSRPVTLRPRGTATVLSFDVEALRPQSEEPIAGSIEWLDGCPPGGGCGYASPASDFAAVEGATVRPGEHGVAVRFVAPATPLFRRGDANRDGRVDISDAIAVLWSVFLSWPGPDCGDAADANDDGGIDLSDPIAILFWIFRDADVIPYPGPFGCGADRTADSLGCEVYELCS